MFNTGRFLVSYGQGKAEQKDVLGAPNGVLQFDVSILGTEYYYVNV